MRRSAALTPLSHDHHHALDVARRLRRATSQDVEERELFPLLESRLSEPELAALGAALAAHP